MENKKTFGAYILHRRKELGMTQREFAQQLYVTESAVSKWERGLSYPDITLLQNICSILDISEYELLNASEDTKRRTSEKLADKYLHLARNYRVIQYVVYGLTLLTCAIVNIATNHSLDWFFIVLAAVMTTASLTLVPAIAAMYPKIEHFKFPVAFGFFTLSLEFLLMICCIYTAGNWFGVAGIGTLFGITLITLPFLLAALPLPPYMSDKKTSVYLITETVLLIILLLVSCTYTNGNWFLVAAVSVIFGLGFFIFPVILRQLVRHSPLCRHKSLIYFGIQTLLLLALLIISDIYTGADILTAVSIPVALLCLLLPWGIMAALRYIPANGWFRASACSAWLGLWIWLTPYISDKILTPHYGNSDTAYSLKISFDFSVWSDFQIFMNVMAIILFTLAALTAILAAAGFIKIYRKRRKI